MTNMTKKLFYYTLIITILLLACGKREHTNPYDPAYDGLFGSVEGYVIFPLPEGQTEADYSVAKVEIESELILEFSTYTDHNGYFILEDIPEGDYTLLCTIDDYQSYRIYNVSITGNNVHNLTEPITLNPVVIGKLLYTSMRSGSFEFWIMNPDGTDPAQLTFNNGGGHRPNYDSNRKRIVYVDWKQAYLYQDAPLARRDSLIIEGSYVSNLGNIERGSNPCWSESGNKFYFDYVKEENTLWDTKNLAYAYAFPNFVVQENIYSINDANGGAYPILSPNGKKLAFVKQEIDKAHICIYDSLTKSIDTLKTYNIYWDSEYIDKDGDGFTADEDVDNDGNPDGYYLDIIKYQTDFYNLAKNYARNSLIWDLDWGDNNQLLYCNMINSYPTYEIKKLNLKQYTNPNTSILEILEFGSISDRDCYFVKNETTGDYLDTLFLDDIELYVDYRIDLIKEEEERALFSIVSLQIDSTEYYDDTILYTPPAEGMIVEQPHWSPDESSIAFVSGEPDASGNLVNSDIWIMHLDYNIIRKLTIDGLVNDNICWVEVENRD